MVMLTLEDCARLRTVLGFAIAEARTAVEGGMIKPDRPKELEESLAWGEDLLGRIEAAGAGKKFGTWIMWGSMPEPGTVPTRYEFSTKEELGAFLRGVDEADGWMEYREQMDDTPWPDPEKPEDEVEGCEFVQKNPHEWFCTTHEVLCIGGTQEPNFCAIGEQEMEKDE